MSGQHNNRHEGNRDASPDTCLAQGHEQPWQFTLQVLRAFQKNQGLLLLIAIGSIVIVPVALQVIGLPDGSSASLLSLLRWPLLFAAILFALACLYRFGPSREHPQWRWVTWGSAIAAGIWIAGSLLLSWYVANFGSYNATLWLAGRDHRLAGVAVAFDDHRPGRGRNQRRSRASDR